MKKTIKRNNIKVPAYTPGGSVGSTPGVGGSAAGKGLTAAQVGAIGQGAITAGGMLANSFLGTSTATTGSQVAAQTAGDIFGGIGKGASIGAAFGPWGAAIGGAIGGVVGSIGSKGREAEMVSFTDYDQGTLGTGLMGAFGANRRLRRERNRIKSNAYANRAAVEGTENLAYEFAQENTMGGVNSFKDGGQVKKPVYMSSPYDLMGGGQEIATDTKEVGYNPQTGEIKINPKYGKEGSDLIHRIAQPGEYWFGKLVNPETGNTFKEDARSIIKKGEVKGARAKFQDKHTAEINKEFVLEQLDVLADAQNRVHQEQNTKPKVKRSVLAGANGMQVPAYDTGSPNKWKIKGPITDFDYWDEETGDYKPIWRSMVETIDDELVKEFMEGKYGSMSDFKTANPNYKPTADEVKKWMLDGVYGDWHKPFAKYVDAKRNELLTGKLSLPTSPDFSEMKKSTNTGQKLNYIVDPDSHFTSRGFLSHGREKNPKNKDYSWIGDWGDALAQIGTLFPQIFAEPDKERAYHNPSWNASRNALSSTINNDEIIKQALLEQGKQRSISNYNLARTSANTGRNLGAMTQTAVNAANAIVDARIRQKLANDQALQAYSDMMNDYGKQYQAEEVRVSNDNDANIASTYMTNMQGIKDAYTRTYGKIKNVKQEKQQQELYDVLKKTFGAYYA